jgi:hypothetical protein
VCKILYMFALPSSQETAAAGSLAPSRRRYSPV